MFEFPDARRATTLRRCSPASRVPSPTLGAKGALDPGCAPAFYAFAGDGQRVPPAGAPSSGCRARPATDLKWFLECVTYVPGQICYLCSRPHRQRL